MSILTHYTNRGSISKEINCRFFNLLFMIQYNNISLSIRIVLTQDQDSSDRLTQCVQQSEPNRNHNPYLFLPKPPSIPVLLTPLYTSTPTIS